ncbi:MAG: hypothetical protein ACRCTD_12840 [Beijerinckiaceae bacterium]
MRFLKWTLAAGAAAAALLSSAQAKPICDRFASRVIIQDIEGRRCAFAYARCRDGEMGADGRFTGRLNSNEIGRGKLVCRAKFAKNAVACLNDNSKEALFCWERLDQVFRPGGLE